jgi:hypothetical protein
MMDMWEERQRRKERRSVGEEDKGEGSTLL